MSQGPKKPCAVCSIRFNTIDLNEHENECFEKIQSKHELYMNKRENVSSSESSNKIQTKEGSIEMTKDEPESFIKVKQSNSSTPESGSTSDAQIKDGYTPIKTVSYNNKQSKTFGEESAVPVSSAKKIDIPMTPEKAQRQALLAEIRSNKSKQLKPVKIIDKEVKRNQSIKKDDQSSAVREIDYDQEQQNISEPKLSDKELLETTPYTKDQKQSTVDEGDESQQYISEPKLSDKELLETTPYPKYTEDGKQSTVNESELDENLHGSEGYSKQLPELNSENEAAYQSHMMNLVPCSYCSRRFNPDRIMIHENACIERPKKREYITPDNVEKK
ncbi:zinc finger protein 474-like isoform X3 [Parasteatoda tepidariorum]|uniref:zinc finger protein 474-like isoform X3 n=1 Tax=Parasteatoda tepidariorum TaxID=114398 RepID=UPI00077FC2B8